MEENMQQDMGRLLLQQETLLFAHRLNFLMSKLSLIFVGTMALFSFSKVLQGTHTKMLLKKNKTKNTPLE